MSDNTILRTFTAKVLTCGERTAAGHVYTKECVDNMLSDDILREKTNSKAFFDTDDMAKVSASFYNIRLEGDDLTVDVDVLNTPYGRALNSIIDDGYEIRVAPEVFVELSDYAISSETNEATVTVNAGFLDKFEIVVCGTAKKTEESI